jgi:hypothetical protein
MVHLCSSSSAGPADRYVQPSKFAFSIAHADTSRATETRPEGTSYDLLAVCECAQDMSAGGIRGRRECGAKSSEESPRRLVFSVPSPVLQRPRNRVRAARLAAMLIPFGAGKGRSSAAGGASMTAPRVTQCITKMPMGAAPEGRAPSMAFSTAELKAKHGRSARHTSSSLRFKPRGN